jgi:hypothetical protein
MASVDYDAEKERARKRSAERNETIWLKLKEGENTIRILPTPKSDTTPGIWYEYRLHREVGPKKTQVRCGKEPGTEKGSCWLCDKILPKLRAKGHEARATALAAKDTMVMQVAVVDNDGAMSGPRLYQPATRVGDQLLSSALSSKKRNYADPKKGYNITISRTGTGRNDTRYGIPEPDDEPSEVPATIIKKLKPFSELKEIPPYSEAKQKAAYEGRDVVDEDDDDDDDDDEEKTTTVDDSEDDEEEEDSEDETDEDEEDEPPAPKKAAVKGKGKPAPAFKSKPKPPAEDEDDEDEEDEEEEDEEEEALPPPKKKTATPAPVKGKGKPPVDEDEEDEEDDIDLDDDEEDEEDTPPPPPKKKAKK